jgi:hypothetical protein
MPQIANQDFIKVKVEGAFAAMDADTKKYLLAKKKEGTIFDCLVESTTQGTSRVLAVHDTKAGSAITKTEITLVDGSTGNAEKVAILG